MSYEGNGVIHLEGTHESIRGPARVTHDPSGTLTIRIEVREPTPEARYPFGAAGLLYREYESPEGLMSLDLGTQVRPVQSVEVVTDSGVLTTSGECQVEPSLDLVGVRTIDVHPQRAVFKSTQEHEGAESWVVPVLNFLGDIPWIDALNTTPLLHHPLRIRPDRDFRITAPEDTAPDGTFVVRSSLLVVEDGDVFIFLERLADFKDRESQLQSYALPNCLTALLVGDVRGRDMGVDACVEWIPFQILPYLGFATGLEAGAPWVEFRDAERRLVQRVHGPFGRQRFDRSWALIRHMHCGLSEILRLCLSQPEATNGRILVALRHLLRSRATSLMLEESLTHVMQGLDGLFGYLKAARTGRQAGVLRDAEHKGFGEKVLTLADQCGLKDRLAIDAIYAGDPALFGMMRWQQWVSLKRNESFHDGFLAVGETSKDHLLLFGLFLHLSDLLTRCLFRILGYTGRYQPSVFLFHGTEWTSDWVTESTTAEDLRYLPQPPRSFGTFQVRKPKAPPRDESESSSERPQGRERSEVESDE